MTKIYALSNHKGGVGKTCSTVNIGAALCNTNKKVLLIDLDPQENLSLSLGIKNSNNSIYDSLCKDIPINEIILSIKPGLDLAPSNLDLSGAEIELASEPGNASILKEKIDKIKDQYDYILIDCPPSLGLLTMNAFVAANSILIPIQSEFLAVQGLTKLTEVIEKIQKRINPDLKIEGVFLTQYDKRKVLNREVEKFIRKNFHDKTFKTKIRDNVSLAETPSKGIDIFSYSPNSSGAKDYLSLTKELLKKAKKEKTRG